VGDLGQAKTKIFLQMGLDRHFKNQPVGQITCKAQGAQ
jgi:hypothetical protein